MLISSLNTNIYLLIEKREDEVVNINCRLDLEDFEDSNDSMPFPT